MWAKIRLKFILEYSLVHKGLVALVIGLGIFLFANGVVMVIVPEGWYWTVPGVPDRGPFNQHFIRDVAVSGSVIHLRRG
jgi:hypothetical protein